MVGGGEGDGEVEWTGDPQTEQGGQNLPEEEIL